MGLAFCQGRSAKPFIEQHLRDGRSEVGVLIRHPAMARVLGGVRGGRASVRTRLRKSGLASCS